MAQHEIKTIVAELQSMSPRTQLEIVRLCKKVAELTPDYIDTLSAETKAELRPLIDANTAAINQEVADRKAIVELDNNYNKMKSNGNDSLAGVYVGDTDINLFNNNLVEAGTLNARVSMDSNKNVKIFSNNFESVFNEDTFTTFKIYADGIYAKPDGNAISIICDDKQIKLDKLANEITLTNNSHVLKLDASGNLTIDGSAVGAKPLYQHNLRFYRQYQQDSYDFTAVIINNSPTPFDKTTLGTYLSTNGFNSNDSRLMATGTHFNTNKYQVFGICYYPNNLYVTMANMEASGYYEPLSNTALPSQVTLTDQVIQIA